MENVSILKHLIESISSYYPKITTKQFFVGPVSIEMNMSELCFSNFHHKIIH